MLKLTITTLLSCLLLVQTIAQESDTVELDPSANELLAYLQMVDSINGLYTYDSGTISIGDDIATLEVPAGFKYLDPEQSNQVLTELWGNPPSETLGMLFLAEDAPMTLGSYVVEISYSEEGYIEDEDAQDLDYEELLQTMKDDIVEANEVRKQQGYETVDLIGWASAPYYDNENKKLHWAKELRFGEEEESTLNYNVRILGRYGYLQLNAIGDMEILPAFEEKIPDVLASINFNKGNTYAEFNPEYDKVAAYGIGGLIAGKILAKAGIFALLAKSWKLILIGIGVAFTAVKKFFGGGKENA